MPTKIDKYTMHRQYTLAGYNKIDWLFYMLRTLKVGHTQWPRLGAATHFMNSMESKLCLHTWKNDRLLGFTNLGPKRVYGVKYDDCEL